MAIYKGREKRLGDWKRTYSITLRFNVNELEKVKAILESYNLDCGKRGTVGPFFRKLILNRETAKEKQIPDGISNLRYQLNKIETNWSRQQIIKTYRYG